MSGPRKKRKRRPVRDRNPANLANWVLRCTVCELEFAKTTTVGVLDAHWQGEHAAEHGETPAMNLVWVGLGPEPQPR